MKPAALDWEECSLPWARHGIGCAISPMINTRRGICVHWYDLAKSRVPEHPTATARKAISSLTLAVICRCGWNSAVQLLAAMPGMKHYLDRVCADSPSLTLHHVLKDQLSNMSLSPRMASSVEPVIKAVYSCTKEPSLERHGRAD